MAEGLRLGDETKGSMEDLARAQGKIGERTWGMSEDGTISGLRVGVISVSMVKVKSVKVKLYVKAKAGVQEQEQVVFDDKKISC